MMSRYMHDSVKEY